MKITARLPLYVRGTPVRNNGTRDILVSTDFDWDIPEISRSETETAFESFNAFTPVVDEDDPLKRARAYEMADSYVLALKHDGNLYRRVSRADEKLKFDRAFPGGYDNSSGDSVGSGISLPTYSFGGDEERRERPFSLPVFRQLRWQMVCNSVRDTTILHQETWPQSFPALRDAPDLDRGLYVRRNSVTFEEVLPKIVTYDHDQLEACRRTYRGHMESFLIVDGELWMKTRPPVYKVKRRYESMEKTSVSVSVEFAPDWQDTRLPDAYFSLASRDDAFEYAQRVCMALAEGKTHGNRPAERGDVIDATSNHLVHDADILAYACEAEELRRVSSGLAVEARRFLVRNPAWKEKFSTDAVDGVFSAFAAVQATNYVLGEYGDPSDWLESNARIWRKTRRGNSTYDFGSVEIGDLLIERALGYEENKPIAVNAVQVSGNAPGRK
ncbi:hypothetical protein HFO56_01610 [Rhizobium laguerreae]|uniref:hypothetical protein n=1 Tax=Rhizobium laguerreae TaxID=1076926 RepID=UPI001C916479|nr:hypothetical protein [Rhizobium laguerreae]MBY3151107.1 hypothetical protein [Rhizobium laguerreae]